MYACNVGYAYIVLKGVKEENFVGY